MKYRKKPVVIELAIHLRHIGLNKKSGTEQYNS